MTVCLLIAVMYHLYTNDSRTRLAGPVHQPFVRRQPFESDRPARVEAPRRAADLRPQAELAAVGELGRGILHADRAVHLCEEAVCAGGVLGDAPVGCARRYMVRATWRGREG